MPDTSPYTQPVRDLLAAINTAAFGPKDGSYYLFLRPKVALETVSELTLEIDYYAADGTLLVREVPGVNP